MLTPLFTGACLCAPAPSSALHPLSLSDRVIAEPPAVRTVDVLSSKVKWKSGPVDVAAFISDVLVMPHPLLG
jgi:hypothetical protein